MGLSFRVGGDAFRVDDDDADAVLPRAPEALEVSRPVGVDEMDETD